MHSRDVCAPALLLNCGLLSAFFVLAIVVIYLTAYNVSSLYEHHHDTLDLHYLRWNQTAEAMFSYWIRVDYLPSHFDLAHIKAMLYTASITALFSLTIIVVSWITQRQRLVETEHSASLRSLSFILAVIRLMLSCGVAIYVGSPLANGSIEFASLPLQKSVSGANTATVQYQSPSAIALERWNCWISDYTVNPLGEQLRAV